MNIYLIRHGDAERAGAGKKDYDRELTQSGRLKLKNAVSGWSSLAGNFDYIITSPLTRAVQTAEIIAEVLKPKNEIIIDKKIAPGSRTESIVEIANYLGGNDIAFVGHQPDFSEHVSALISSSGAYVEFKKGSIAKIAFHNKAHLSKGVLEFLIPAGTFK